MDVAAGDAGHPRRPLLVCGDTAGTLYSLEVVGIEYGPSIVTAVDRGEGPELRCPGCLAYIRLDGAWLGGVIDCP